MGLWNSYKKGVEKRTKKAIAAYKMFVPGLGIVMEGYYEVYKALSSKDRNKFAKLKGKKAKENFLSDRM